MTAKMVMLGAENVGKSTIALKLADTQDLDGDKPRITIGAAITEFRYKGLRIQTLDTAGQERFAEMLTLYYRNAQIALLVFDITDQNSFERVKRLTIKLREEQPETQLVLLGNKADLAQHRAVFKADAEQFAALHGVAAIEYSAKLSSRQDLLTHLEPFLNALVEEAQLEPEEEDMVVIKPAVHFEQKAPKKCCG